MKTADFSHPYEGAPNVMGTVELRNAPLKWAFGPISFSPDDLLRLAEYFDDSLEGVGVFLREVWLPEASRTLQTLIRESGSGHPTRLTFLCDHLREGARTAGAATMVEAADLIECALRSGEREKARSLAALAIHCICQLSLDLAA